ncbi:hypothetical protein D9758_014337 [Tetrapyrgos nigripes]|uniref:Uncharacterized protein n=1 Tax=Tetrapyrgos nigripes TaxID=182062 RepID=A0A8H5CB23_9AGAR|nr:hypothetical protein D9758_014337 [Tetrapyrgos nigripes]
MSHTTSLMQEADDCRDPTNQAGSSWSAERDSDVCSINSLINGYFCYSLPTIEEEDVQMDDVDVLEDEDLEFFWRGILKPGHNRRRTIYEDHTEKEETTGEEDDILIGRVSVSRQSIADGNMTSFFSSCSTIEGCFEDVVEEPSGREGSVQSVTSSGSETHTSLTRTSTPKSTVSKTKPSEPSSSKSHLISTPPAKKSKLLLPLTKLPKRLTESLSSFSLPYSSRKKSFPHKFPDQESHRNLESPLTLDIRPEYLPPDTPTYTKYSNHDSWTSTISTLSSSLSSSRSSPISSPTSSFFPRSFPPSESLKENLNSHPVGIASPSSTNGFQSSFMRQKPVPDFEDDDRSWLPDMDDRFGGGFGSTAPLRVIKRRSSRDQSLGF